VQEKRKATNNPTQTAIRTTSKASTSGMTHKSNFARPQPTRKKNTRSFTPHMETPIVGFQASTNKDFQKKK